MPDQNIKETIKKRNNIFMETYERGDAEGMAELYTDDGEVLPPNAETVKGKEAVKNFWQATMDLGIKAIKLETGEVEQHGDTANEVSKATLMGPDQQVLDQSKYIVIWKRVNGEWLLHRDIFNSSLPAQ